MTGRRLAATLSESRGDKSVHSDSDQSRDYHEAALNRLWISDPARSFDRDENDDHNQRGAVHRRGENADPMVAVSTPCIRRTLGLFDREPSQPEGDDVGQDGPASDRRASEFEANPAATSIARMRVVSRKACLSAVPVSP